MTRPSKQLDSGHKTSVQDEVVHVPLVIAPPAGTADFAPGAVDQTVETWMVFGTVLEQLGIESGPGAEDFDPEAAPRWTADGLRGEGVTPGRAYSGLFLEGTDPRHGKRFKKATLVEDRYKLNYDMTRGVLELFDLEVDPGESRALDHWGQREVLVPMRDEHLIAWIQRMERTAEEVRRLELAPVDRARLEALGYGGAGEPVQDDIEEGSRP